MFLINEYCFGREIYTDCDLVLLFEATMNVMMDERGLASA
jgi:hypothetical protein